MIGKKKEKHEEFYYFQRTLKLRFLKRALCIVLNNKRRVHATKVEILHSIFLNEKNILKGQIKRRSSQKFEKWNW